MTVVSEGEGLSAAMAEALLGALAESREARVEAPVAAAAGRCARPPLGCGLPLSGGFRDECSVREYGITGMCQSCQDRLYGMVAEDAEEAEIEEMRACPERFYRCRDCGEWCEYEFVDVGVGVERYETCHAPLAADYVPFPACPVSPGCWMGDGHLYDCEVRV